MDKLDLYNQAFIECFGVSEEDLNSELSYQSISSWDSVGHMALIGELESRFEILMEMDDIIDFSSYEVGKEILKNYNIQI